ncbi:MAG: DUF3416 domain-containing protein, partial [Chloroflexi bacterium]|nr:DUF3416 domain-containing protein [Chloroflexota bacterium]
MDTRFRVVIEGLTPEVDGGRFPVKRVPGEDVVVEADIFTDGHDAVSGVLRYRREDEAAWSEATFEPLVNDRWRARFMVSETGAYVYTARAWVDRFKSWRRDLQKRLEAGQDIGTDLLVGAGLIDAAAARAEDAGRAPATRAADVAPAGGVMSQADLAA